MDLIITLKIEKNSQNNTLIQQKTYKQLITNRIKIIKTQLKTIQ